MPLEYAGGVDEEVARARSSSAVFDLSFGAPLRVAYNDPEGFLRELTGQSTARAGEVDLLDPLTRAVADRALVVPLFVASRTVLGSALDRGYLHDWLRARGAERAVKAPTIEMPTLWPGPVLVFVGPQAPATAASTLDDPAITAMADGDYRPGDGLAEYVVRATRHGLPAVWAWVNRTKSDAVGERCRSLFAGSLAEQRLDEAAGLSPRRRWTGAHQPPWTSAARIELVGEPVRDAAPVQKATTRKTTARKTRA
jgi:hypothetical protein